MRYSMNRQKSTLGRTAYRAGAATMALTISMLMAGCDVTNPGPVQDEFLGDPQSQPGLVNGSVRMMSELVTWTAYTTALLSREIFPGGQTGAGGHNVSTQGGHVLPGSYGGYFNDAQQARFIAETAIDRFDEVGAPDALKYRAHLWAGYAYRTLGENWCEAVIDGGSLQPGSVYFENSVQHFTDALGLASSESERHAARAGRAAAYAWLGEWANAAMDAGQVPNDFTFWLEMDQTGGTDYHNWLYFANANQPYRSYSIWNTFFEDYYTETGDPRTPWAEDPAEPYANAALSGYGQVPWSFQLKYTTRDDDIRLASGWEMRLLEAEAILEGAVPGDHLDAMALINAVRTRNVSDTNGLPLVPWVAANAEDAWTYLKRERAIELWLEGRRMGDERRWMENNTPGELDTPDWDGISPLFTERPRSFCFDIPDSERDSNPNVPATSG
jgi:starch-binding outer membrane protein, SusD/RagB family